MIKVQARLVLLSPKQNDYLIQSKSMSKLRMKAIQGRRLITKGGSRVDLLLIKFLLVLMVFFLDEKLEIEKIKSLCGEISITKEFIVFCGIKGEIDDEKASKAFSLLNLKIIITNLKYFLRLFLPENLFSF